VFLLLAVAVTIYASVEFCLTDCNITYCWLLFMLKHEPVLVKVTKECEYIIDWKTPYACPLAVSSLNYTLHFISCNLLYSSVNQVLCTRKKKLLLLFNCPTFLCYCSMSSTQNGHIRVILEPVGPYWQNLTLKQFFKMSCHLFQNLNGQNLHCWYYVLSFMVSVCLCYCLLLAICIAYLFLKLDFHKIYLWVECNQISALFMLFYQWWCL